MSLREDVRCIAVVGIVALVCSCAGMLPKIQDTYRMGYAKLVAICPQCANPDLQQYSACLEAAKLFEMGSQEKATNEFVAYWEKSVIGAVDTHKKAEEKKDYFDALNYAIDKQNTIRNFQAIVIPTLKTIYRENATEYSARMLKALDQIVPDSKTSLETFREAHSRAAYN